MSYEVATSVYDGPFDLLLHLILKDEVDLYEVSLTTIVDAFVAEVERMEVLNLDSATEFLMIAATLVELKSRRLLPDIGDGDLDDELALWEERDLLLSRLLECKTFKDASAALQVLTMEAARSHPRRAGLEEPFIGLMPDLLAGIDATDICDAFMRATAPKPTPTVSLHHVNPIRISVADACEDVIIELQRRSQMTFRAMTAQLADRIEVVVYFLAALELYKQGFVEITQFDTFGEITLQWLGTENANDKRLLEVVDAYDG